MIPDPGIKIKISGLNFRYGERRILCGIDTTFESRRVTAIAGASGQGKSTLLTVLNRLWEEIPGAHLEGEVKIRIGGIWTDIYSERCPAAQLRQAVGMVFQEPNPLPMSIFKNVAFPLKLAGIKDRTIVESKVRNALQKAFLWEEVKDRLGHDARTLSGGQQQRLCIARALVPNPEVLLLDEPTASLDARACGIIEDLLLALKTNCTIVMVSHYMDQVRRVADCVMELNNGSLRSRSRTGNPHKADCF